MHAKVMENVGSVFEQVGTIGITKDVLIVINLEMLNQEVMANAHGVEALANANIVEEVVIDKKHQVKVIIII